MKTAIHNRILLTALAAFTVVLIAGSLLIFPSRILQSPNTVVSNPDLLTEKKGGRREELKRKVARDDYFNLIYRDPALGRIPEGIRERELAFARTLPKDGNSTAKGNALQIDWKEAGPTDVGGRTRALVIDATNSNTLISGAASGGIWKSTDAGASWRLVSASHLSITDIAQDTRAGQTSTWYASTGEITNSFNTNGAPQTANLFGTGLYKSTDSGESWTQIQSAGNPTRWDTSYDFVVRLVVSPTTGTVFYVENSDGLFRSTDGGSSFSTSYGTAFEHTWGDVAVDSNGNLLLVLAGDPGSASTVGVFRSTDDGVTWTAVFENNGASFPAPFNAEFSRPVIAIAPSNPDVAYILTFMGAKKAVTGGNIDDVRFHKLTISTGTYEDRSANIPVFLDGNGTVNNGTLDTQQAYNMTIAVHPNDENHVFIGGTTLFRSRDGFATAPSNKDDNWIGGYSTADNNASYANNHPDQHLLRFETSAPFRLYNGHDGGLSVADDVTPNGAIAWRSLNNGYNVTQFYSVSIARAAGDDRILGGTQDNGSPFFRWDGTLATASNDVSTGDGGFAYVGSAGIYSSSQNGALQFEPIPPSGSPSFNFAQDIAPCSNCGALFVNPAVVNPNSEGNVFYPAGADLYRRDAGNWSQLPVLTLPAGFGFSALSMSTTPEDVLYYAAFSQSDSPKVFRLDDAKNATGAAVERSPSAAGAGEYILSIGVNPADADEILVVISNFGVASIYHSTDGGQTYADVEGNLAGSNADGPSVRAATILPFSGENTYFLATSVGVFSASAMSGSSTTWIQVASDVIGSTATAWIDSRMSDGRVAIATHGRGIFVGTSSGGQTITGNVTFTVDMNRELRLGTLSTGDVVGVRGSVAPLSWNTTNALTDSNGDGVYSGSVSFTQVNQQSVEYKFVTEVEGTPNLEGSVGSGSSGNRVFAFSGNQDLGSVFWNNVSGVASEVEGEIPTEFVLQGAYPNPFNPSTTLRFDLPESAVVRVQVSDMLGRSVLAIPAQSMSAGSGRNIRIDASGLASGAYIYRVFAAMQSRTVVQTGKFVLLK